MSNLKDQILYSEPESAASQSQAACADELIEVRVRRTGENWFLSRISSLDSHSFCLHSCLQVSPGEILHVMFRGFEGRPARVVWTENHLSYCVFDRSVHSGVLDYIRRIARQG
jgi:hypothetical protein